MAIAKPGKISPTRNLSHDNILDHLLNLDQVFFVLRYKTKIIYFVNQYYN